MRKNKYFLTFVIIMAGVLILSTAAFANYDSASGYTNFKNAYKDLVFAKNFTLEANFSIDDNGQVLNSQKVLIKNDYADGNETYSHQDTEYRFNPKVSKNDATYNSYSILQDGKVYYLDTRDESDGNTWNENDYYGSGTPLDFGDEATTRKTVRFMELLADAFVGDIKNNFIVVKSEAGFKDYEVNLEREQIPEIVNAGLSMVFGNMRVENHNNSYIVANFDCDYSDPAEAARIDELWAKANQELETKGGIIVIEKDGSLTNYATEKEYHENNDEYYDGFEFIMDTENDPYISKATCHFTLDDQGRITANQITGTLTIVDASGVKHDLTVKIDLKFSDYGTTVPDRLPDDAKILSYDEKEYTLPAVQTTVLPATVETLPEAVKPETVSPETVKLETVEAE